MSLSNTILRATLPSGNVGVYKLQPHHLCHVPGTTLNQRALWYGEQLAVKLGGTWYKPGGLAQIHDRRTLELLETCPDTTDTEVT